MRGNKSFNQKWSERARAVGSSLCVGLDPDLSKLPAGMRPSPDHGETQTARRAPNPVLAFNRWLVERTAPYACAFKLNASFYEALGPDGWHCLRDSIACVPEDIPVILDAKRADVGPSAEAYARAVFDVLDADAVTVNPYLGQDSLAPFVQRVERGVFVLCHTSNPGASAFQELTCAGRSLYERVAELAVALNARGNVGLVVGATYPDALRRVRAVAPRMLLLVPGIGAQAGDLEAAVAAGMAAVPVCESISSSSCAADPRAVPDAADAGLLVNVSRAVIYDEHPDQAAARWRDAINAARARPSPTHAETQTAQPGSAVVLEDELALALYDSGCVQFGEFRLHSGELSPLYIDLRLLVSHPPVLQKVASALVRVLGALSFDRIAAIPYAALPIGTAVALESGWPLLYPRREIKSYGTQRAIEGQFRPHERAVVLDDVLTTGKSKLEAILSLRAAGLRVEDIVVLVDREQGGAQQLLAQGYRVHPVLRLSRVLEALARHGRISAEQQERVRAWMEGKP